MNRTITTHSKAITPLALACVIALVFAVATVHAHGSCRATERSRRQLRRNSFSYITHASTGVIPARS